MHFLCLHTVEAGLNLGKEYLYVWETGPGRIHENDAALRMAGAAAGQNIKLSDPSEGKVNLVAGCRGLLKVNEAYLYKINSIEEIMMATLHTNQLVNVNQIVAGIRVIPLVAAEEKIIEVENICREAEGILEVLPMRPLRVGIVIKGLVNHI